MSYMCNPQSVNWHLVYDHNKMLTGRVHTTVWDSHTEGRPDGHFYVRLEYELLDESSIWPINGHKLKTQRVGKKELGKTVKEFWVDTLQYVNDFDRLLDCLAES